MKSLLCILLLLSSAVLAAADEPTMQTFFTLNVRDAEASAGWYARTFALKEIKRFDQPAFVMRILGNGRLVVELIQRKPELAAGSRERQLGYTKVGVVLTDFDAAIERWQKEQVQFFGGGQPRIFLDEALGLHHTLLLDPDGNLVQIFGRRATAN